MTSKVTYTGDLRTQSVHLQSGKEFITDAPLDNHGLGQAFSPTDTVANAVATCMLTVMGIKARALGVDITGATAEVTKTMASDPRRISGVAVNLSMPAAITGKDRKILENTGKTCPVILSLSPAIEKELEFHWVL
jgi:putative redox protein